MVARVPILALLVATPAAAQFVDLDPMDGSITGEVRSAVVFGGTNTATLSRLYLQGGAKGWGGYLAVPVVATADRLDAGNLELGAILDIDGPLMSLTFRAGAVLPTAPATSTADEAAGDAWWARVADMSVRQPDFAGLRLSGSIRLPAGLLFLRTDAGFDFTFPVAGGQTSAFLRANIALGLQYGLFHTTVDYATASGITVDEHKFEDASDNPINHSFGMSLRLRTPYVQPWIAGSAGLNVKRWIVSGGVTVRWLWGKDGLETEQAWP